MSYKDFIFKLNKTIWSILAILIFLIIISISLYYYLLPNIRKHILAGAQKYHVNMDLNSVGPQGAIINNVQIAVTKDLTINTKAARIRPPLSFVSGFVVASQVKMNYKNLHIIIPKLQITGIGKSTPLPALPASKLSKIFKYKFSHLYIPYAYVTIDKPGGEQIDYKLQGLKIDNYESGKISNITLHNLYMKLEHGDKSSETSNIGYIQLSDLNLGNIYRLTQPNIGQRLDIFRQLNALNINYSKKSETLDKNASIYVQSFDLGPLIVQSFEQGLQYYLKQAKLSDAKSKIDALRAMGEILAHIKTINLALLNTHIKLPKAQFTIAKAEFCPKNWHNKLPYDLSMSCEKLQLDKFSELAEKFHLSNYDMKKHNEASAKIEFHYNPNNGTAIIKQSMLEIPNMASINFSANLSKIDPAIFDLDENALKNFAKNAKFQHITLNLNNQGAVDLISELLTIGDIKKEDVRNLLYTIIEKSPPMLIGNKQIGDIIGKSLADLARKTGSSINLTAQAKDPAGISWNHIFNNPTMNIEQFNKIIDLKINKTL